MKKLSPIQQELYDYIIENYEDVSNMTIRQLSHHTHVSTSSILRLTRKLGYSGYREFILDLYRLTSLSAIKGKQVNENYPFIETDSEKDIIDKISIITQDTIEACKLLLKPKQIKKVVESLRSADNIIGIAISDSYLSLLDFQNKLLKINKYLKISYLQPEGAYLCAHAGSNDVGFFISYSGYSAEVINEAKILKELRVPIISMTSDIHSPLAILSDEIIELSKLNYPEALPYSFSSKIAIEYTLNIIYSCLYRYDFQSNLTHFKKTQMKYLNK